MTFLHWLAIDSPSMRNMSIQYWSYMFSNDIDLWGSSDLQGVRVDGLMIAEEAMYQTNLCVRPSSYFIPAWHVLLSRHYRRELIFAYPASVLEGLFSSYWKARIYLNYNADDNGPFQNRARYTLAATSLRMH